MTLNHHKHHIACQVLSHGIDDINVRSLESMIECDSRLKIDVAHNPYPEESGDFLKFASDQTASGKLRSLMVFERNISNNALQLALLRNRDRNLESKYIVISDCDILAPTGLIDEQISILENNLDLLVCGLRVDASLWDNSLPVKSELMERFNSDKFEMADHVASATGLWMAMFRTAEFYMLLDTIEKNNLRLTDGNLKSLGFAKFRKRWSATKNSIGRELNRERETYHVTKAVSSTDFGGNSPEQPGSRYSTWNHNLVSEAELQESDSKTKCKFDALRPAVPRFRSGIGDDPVIKEIQAGRLSPVTGKLVRTVPLDDRTDIFFVLVSGKPQTGIPYLSDRQSLIYVSCSESVSAHLVDLLEIDVGRLLANMSICDASSLLNLLVSFISNDGKIVGWVPFLTLDTASEHFNVFALCALAEQLNLKLQLLGGPKNFSNFRFTLSYH